MIQLKGNSSDMDHPETLASDGGGRDPRFSLQMKEGDLSLSQEDSNLYKQNQNLLCYHYTTRQPNHSPTPAGAENAVQR